MMQLPSLRRAFSRGQRICALQNTQRIARRIERILCTRSIGLPFLDLIMVRRLRMQSLHDFFSEAIGFQVAVAGIHRKRGTDPLPPDILTITTTKT